MASHIVPVSLNDRSYDVEIAPGCLEQLGDKTVAAVGLTPRAFLVADAGLPLTAVDVAHASLARAGYRVDIGTIRPSEEAKSVATWARLAEQVASAGLQRGEPIVALGGGIVGDVAGFLAATYQRGVPFIQCPTTLLAMVDAAVGGKTGVNLSVRQEQGPPLLLKNMLGSFHQPAAVVADVALLRTLSERDFRCGLAECVKHGMLAADFGQPDLLAWTESHADQILCRREDDLADLIARNVAVKASVVAADERESAPEGGRALLNLGHTFAHAFEAMEGLLPDDGQDGGPLRHGEAVALGLLCATRLAASLGRPVSGLCDEIAALLDRFGLPTSLKRLPDVDVVMGRIEHDKKARAGSLRFVLPEAPGRCSVASVGDRARVVHAVQSLGTLGAPPTPTTPPTQGTS